MASSVPDFRSCGPCELPASGANLGQDLAMAMRAITGIAALLFGLQSVSLGAEVPVSRARLAGDDEVLCSYLKDVESKTDAACGAENLASLRERDAATYAGKLEAARRRKAEVQRAFEFLASPKDPKKAAGIEERGQGSGAGDSDPTRLQPPINERTFPAWISAGSRDVSAAYARWIKPQDPDGSHAEPRAPPARDREAEAAIAANRANVSALGRIRDAAEMNCFLGESCGIREEVPDPVERNSMPEEAALGSAHAPSAATPNANSSKGLLTLRRSDVPPVGAPDPLSPGEPSPLLPIAIPLGVGLIGYGIYRGRQGYVSEDGLNPTPKGEPTPGAVRTNRLIKSALAAGAIVVTSWAAVTYLPPLLATIGPITTQVVPTLAGAGGGAAAGTLVAEETTAAGAVKAGFLVGGAYVGSRGLSTVETKTDFPGYSFARSEDDESSRLRGRDSKRGHDRSGRLRDEDFRRWFHRNWKQPGDQDASKEALEEAYAEWLRQGKPSP